CQKPGIHGRRTRARTAANVEYHVAARIAISAEGDASRLRMTAQRGQRQALWRYMYDSDRALADHPDVNVPLLTLCQTCRRIFVAPKSRQLRRGELAEARAYSFDELRGAACAVLNCSPIIALEVAAGSSLGGKEVVQEG